jgi:hypothetical protein
VKLKSLAVITLLVLGCASAFANSYTFGFLSYTGGLQYCNYEQLQTIDGIYLVQGLDVLTVGCGYPVDATADGAKGSAPAAAGLPVSGGGYWYADNLYDAACLCWSGAQWNVFTKTKASSKKFGWIGFASYSYFIFGDNYGFLTKTIPGKKTPTHGTVIGSLKAPRK